MRHCLGIRLPPDANAIVWTRRRKTDLLGSKGVVERVQMQRRIHQPRRKIVRVAAATAIVGIVDARDVATRRHVAAAATGSIHVTCCVRVPTCGIHAGHVGTGLRASATCARTIDRAFSCVRVRVRLPTCSSHRCLPGRIGAHTTTWRSNDTVFAMIGLLRRRAALLVANYGHGSPRRDQA